MPKRFKKLKINWGLVFFHSAFVCVSARNLESVATPETNSKDLTWFRTEPVKCLWRPGCFFIWREHSFRIPTQIKEDFPGTLTWWALDSSFCPLIPGWSHRAAQPHRGIRGHPQGRVAPVCLAHLPRPPFSQDLAWPFFAIWLVLWFLQENVLYVFPVTFRGRLNLNYPDHHSQHLNSSHRYIFSSFYS